MNNPNDSALINYELLSLIDKCDDFAYSIRKGQEEIFCNSIEECLECSLDIIKNSKKELYDKWEETSHFCDLITNEQNNNKTCCLDNILFIFYLKKIYLLSLKFDELSEISDKIEKVFNLDISHINHEFIEDFNSLYLSIYTEHVLILKEIYRSKIIKKYLDSLVEKTASVAGPWSNLDLPMLERVFPWEGEQDDYMENRTKARQEQVRYNPESNYFGVYFVWNEPRRAPYRFGDKDESIYPSRDQLSVANVVDDTIKTAQSGDYF